MAGMGSTDQAVHGLTLADSQISTMTGFLDNSTLPIFGLPRTLPD